MELMKKPQLSLNMNKNENDNKQAIYSKKSLDEFYQMDEDMEEIINRNAEYQISPSLIDKFKSLSVKEIIRSILNEKLGDKEYALEEAEGWTKDIVSCVKDSIKELGFKRYKLIVQTILGENKGSGVKVGARCLWDADTDNYASDYFLNKTMFCCVIVFGIYCY